MKNVFKKLFSLMLVAVMLVSVLPVTASAAAIDPSEWSEDELNNCTWYVVKYMFEGAVVGRVESKEIDDAATADYYAEIDKKSAEAWMANWDQSQSATKYKVADDFVSAPRQFGELKDKVFFEVDVVVDDGGSQGGGDQTPTTQTVSISYKFNDTEVATGTATVAADKTSLTTDEVKAALGNNATYMVPGENNTYEVEDGKCSVQVVKINPDVEYKDVKFINEKSNETFNVRVYKGQAVSGVPAGKLILNEEFLGWFATTNSNAQIQNGDVYNDLSWVASEYKASYKTNSDGTKDGLSVLTLKAKFYVGDKEARAIPAETIGKYTLPDNTYIVKWLDQNVAVKDELAKHDWALGYEWDPEVYYDYTSNAELTKTTMINNGDKTVYIKLQATESNKAKVLLYVHSKVGSANTHPIEMTGYVKNGRITDDQVWEVIKKDYKTSSKTKMDGLYSKETWAMKCNDEKPTPVEALDIEGNNVFEIHVVLTNATLKTGSGTADSSNPKTGDSIFMVVTVMAVSATALAGAYIFNKKRMVK